MEGQTERRAKRQRVSERGALACTYCKQKKLKCDRKIPQCDNCVKTNRECSECLIEDPGTGLPRPRNYVQDLESKVAQLQELLRQSRSGIDSDLPASDRDVGQHNHEWPPNRRPRSDQHVVTEPAVAHATHRTTSTEEEYEADELSADVALLCTRAAGREPEYLGPTSAVSLARVISSAMRLPKGTSGGGSKSSTVGHPLRVQELLKSAPAGFPPLTVRSTLSAAYFDNIHPQYPFLHRPTFERWQDACVESDTNGNGFASAGDVPVFFVLMVYAIGSLSLGPSLYDSAASYYTMALEYEPAILELNSLESIQSLLACAVYSIRSPRGASLWKASGMAMRNCIELGYHRSVAKCRRHTHTLTAEMSKRCFWVAYDLDRIASFYLGRPIGIYDEYIDVELPLDIDDKNITSNGLTGTPRLPDSDVFTDMTSALHMIKLRRLWTKISTSIYPPIPGPNEGQDSSKRVLIEQLAQELDDWYSKAPISPPETSAPNPISVFASRDWFRLANHHTILILYRYWLMYSSTFEDDEFTDRAFSVCFDTAREMCLTYRKLHENPDMQFTWGLVHVLFLAGITYIYCIWKSPRIRESARKMDVINTCVSCHTVLVIIAERWSHAASLRRLFEFLLEKTVGLMCGTPEESTHAPGLEAVQASSEPVDNGMPMIQNWILNLEETHFTQESDHLLMELLGEVGDDSFDPQLLAMNGDDVFLRDDVLMQIE